MNLSEIVAISAYQTPMGSFGRMLKNIANYDIRTVGVKESTCSIQAGKWAFTANKIKITAIAVHIHSEKELRMLRIKLLKILAVGSHALTGDLTARIERIKARREKDEGSSKSLEVLRFCNCRQDGRFSRVHLVLSQDEFICLLKNAIRNNVFHADSIWAIRDVCTLFLLSLREQ